MASNSNRNYSHSSPRPKRKTYRNGTSSSSYTERSASPKPPRTAISQHFQSSYTPRPLPPPPSDITTTSRRKNPVHSVVKSSPREPVRATQHFSQSSSRATGNRDVVISNLRGNDDAREAVNNLRSRERDRTMKSRDVNNSYAFHGGSREKLDVGMLSRDVGCDGRVERSLPYGSTAMRRAGSMESLMSVKIDDDDSHDSRKLMGGRGSFTPTPRRRSHSSGEKERDRLTNSNIYTKQKHKQATNKLSLSVSLCINCLSVSLSVCLSVNTYIFIDQCYYSLIVQTPVFCLSVCQSVCLPICLSVCLFVFLSVCLSVCLFVLCLFVCLSLSVCMYNCFCVCKSAL